MKCLTACDALSDRLVRVTADMHPASDDRDGRRETVYVVFDEGPEASAGQAFSGAG